MKRLTAIMLKASDIVSLCFLIPLLFISFSLYRSVEFGTLRESTFEVRDNPFVNLLILIAVLLLFVLIKKGMKRCGEPVRWRIVYIVTAACAVFLLIFGCVWINLNPFEALADQEEVWKAVLDLADGGGAVRTDLLYFREYPQQKNMAVIMSVLAWITGKSIRGYNYLNLVFIIAAVSLMAFCVKEVTRRAETMVITVLLLTAFLPFTLYSKFIYGSVAGIFFSVLSAYGLIRFMNGGSWLYLVLPTVFVPLSVMLYQSELIYLIAFVLILAACIFREGSDNAGRSVPLVLSLAAILIITFALSALTSGIFDGRLGTIDHGGDGIPASGHVLMGLQEMDDNMPGNYNGSSQRAYEELGYDSDKADRFLKESIAERLRELGDDPDSFRFFLKKTECQWLDPWFGGLTMNVYDEEYRYQYDERTWISFTEGSFFPCLENCIRILMILIYGGAAVCLLLRLKGGNSARVTAYIPGIYFAGGFIFQFIWEQKSRYCLPYYLALFPLAAAGIVGMLDVCEERTAKWGNDKKAYAAAGGLICLGLLSFAAEQRSFEQAPGTFRDETTKVFRTKDLHLPKGDYGIIVSYKAAEDTEIMLYLENGGTGYPVALTGDNTQCEIPAYMDSYKDNVHFEYPGEYSGRIELDRINVYSPKLIYYDLFYITFIIAVLLYPCYLLFIESFIRKKSGIDKIGTSFIVFGVILAAPLAIYLSRWFHVRVLCSRLRVSAEFSVYLTLAALILMAFCVRYSKRNK